MCHVTTSTCSTAAMASLCEFTFCFVEVHVEPWFKHCATTAGRKTKQVHHTEATKACVQKPTQACFKKPAKAFTKRAIKCFHKRATKCLHLAISSLQKGSNQCLQKRQCFQSQLKLAGKKQRTAQRISII